MPGGIKLNAERKDYLPASVAQNKTPEALKILPKISSKLDVSGLQSATEGWNVERALDLRQQILLGQIKDGEILEGCMHRLNINPTQLNEILNAMDDETFSIDAVFRHMNPLQVPGFRSIIQNYLRAYNNDYNTMASTVYRNLSQNKNLDVDIEDELGSVDVIGKSTLGDYKDHLPVYERKALTNINLTDLLHEAFQEPPTDTDSSAQNLKDLRSQGSRDILQNMVTEIHYLVDYLSQFNGKDQEKLEEEGLLHEHPQRFDPDYVEDIEIIVDDDDPKMETLSEMIEDWDDTDEENLVFTALFIDSCDAFGVSNYQRFLKVKDGTYQLDLDDIHLTEAHIKYLEKMFPFYADRYTSQVDGDNLTETIHLIHNDSKHEGKTYQKMRSETIQSQLRTKKQIQTAFISKYNQIKNLDEISPLRSDIDLTKLHSATKTTLNNLKNWIQTAKGQVGEESKREILKHMQDDILELLNYEVKNVEKVIGMIFSGHNSTVMAEYNDYSLLNNDEISLRAIDSYGSQLTAVERSNIYQSGMVEGNLRTRLIEDCQDANGQISEAKLIQTLQRYADNAQLTLIPLKGLTPPTPETIKNLKGKIKGKNWDKLNQTDIKILRQGAFNQIQSGAIESQYAMYQELQATRPKAQQQLAHMLQLMGQNAQTGNDTQSQQMFEKTTDIVFHLGALSNAGIAQAILNQLTAEQRDKLNKGVGVQVTCIKTSDGFEFKVDAGYDAGNDQASVGFEMKIPIAGTPDSTIITWKNAGKLGYFLENNSGSILDAIGARIETGLAFESNAVGNWFEHGHLVVGSDISSLGLGPYLEGRLNIFDGYKAEQYEEFREIIKGSEFIKSEYKNALKNDDISSLDETQQKNLEKTFITLRAIARSNATTPAQLKFLLSENSAIDFKAYSSKYFELFYKRFKDKSKLPETNPIRRNILSMLATQIAENTLGMATSQTWSTEFTVGTRVYANGLIVPTLKIGVKSGQTMLGTRRTDDRRSHALLAGRSFNQDSNLATIQANADARETRAMIRPNADGKISDLKENTEFMAEIESSGFNYEFTNGKHYLKINGQHRLFRNSQFELRIDEGFGYNPSNPSRIAFDPSKPLYINKAITYEISGYRGRKVVMSLSQNPNQTAMEMQREKPTEFITLREKRTAGGDLTRQAVALNQATSALSSYNTENTYLKSRIAAKMEAPKPISPNTTNLLEAIRTNPKTAQRVFEQARITGSADNYKPKQIIAALKTFAEKINVYRPANGKPTLDTSKISAWLKDEQVISPDFEFLMAQMNPVRIEQISGRLKTKSERKAHITKVAEALKVKINDITGLANIDILQGFKMENIPATKELPTQNANLAGHTLLTIRHPKGQSSQQGLQSSDIYSANQVQILQMQAGAVETLSPVQHKQLILAAHKMWEKSGPKTKTTNNYSRTETRLMQLSRGPKGKRQNILTDLYGQKGANGELTKEQKTHWENLMKLIQENPGGQVIVTHPITKEKVGSITVTKDVKRIFLANCCNPSLTFKLDLKYTPEVQVRTRRTRTARVRQSAIGTNSVGINLSYAFDQLVAAPPMSSSAKSQNSTAAETSSGSGEASIEPSSTDGVTQSLK